MVIYQIIPCRCQIWAVWAFFPSGRLVLLLQPVSTGLHSTSLRMLLMLASRENRISTGKGVSYSHLSTWAATCSSDSCSNTLLTSSTGDLGLGKTMPSGASQSACDNHTDLASSVVVGDVAVAISAPSQPTSQVGIAGDEIHSQWTGIYVRTAMCDGCETRGHAVLQRCSARGCALQVCHACARGDRYDISTHRLSNQVSWLPPRRAPRRRRGAGRVRGG